MKRPAPVLLSLFLGRASPIECLETALNGLVVKWPIYRDPIPFFARSLAFWSKSGTGPRDSTAQTPGPHPRIIAFSRLFCLWSNFPSNRTSKCDQSAFSRDFCLSTKFLGHGESNFLRFPGKFACFYPIFHQYSPFIPFITGLDLYRTNEISIQHWAFPFFFLLSM